MYSLPKYNKPDFNESAFFSSKNATFVEVLSDGIAPKNYLATTIYPTYIKIDNEWKLVEKIRMDCVIVNKNGTLKAVEFRNLKKHDLVLVGRTEDGSDGIYVNYDPFPEESNDAGAFAFRQNRTRETSYSKTYDDFYDILRFEKEHGNIVWVMGPAAVFDKDSRSAFESLINKGYVNGLLAGNAFGTHDLEGAYFCTALGQNIYTKKSAYNGHYHHLEILNMARETGSVKEFIKKYDIKNGAMYALEKNNVPYVLAGSIRDDGPLPPVYGNVYEAQNAMRSLVENATTVIALATQLHTIATGNMTPAYTTLPDGTIRPVHFYMVDISEFVLNKLSDRGSLSAKGIVTNVQDFLVNIDRNLD